MTRRDIVSSTNYKLQPILYRLLEYVWQNTAIGVLNMALTPLYVIMACPNELYTEVTEHTRAFDL